MIGALCDDNEFEINRLIGPPYGSEFMIISILRTDDSWWVQTAAGAAKIATTAATTGELLTGRTAIDAAAHSADTVPVPKPEGYSNTAALGELLYTKYLYPFEVAAVILLVAIVAAITLTMRRRTGQKLQDIARQVSVRASDRVRIVKMDAERRP